MSKNGKLPVRRKADGVVSNIFPEQMQAGDTIFLEHLGQRIMFTGEKDNSGRYVFMGSGTGLRNGPKYRLDPKNLESNGNEGVRDNSWNPARRDMGSPRMTRESYYYGRQKHG